MREMRTTPLHDDFGVEIHGVDLRVVTAEMIYPEIRALFEAVEELGSDPTSSTASAISGFSPATNFPVVKRINKIHRLGCPLSKCN